MGLFQEITVCICTRKLSLMYNQEHKSMEVVYREPRGKPWASLSRKMY